MTTYIQTTIHSKTAKYRFKHSDNRNQALMDLEIFIEAGLPVELQTTKIQKESLILHVNSK